MGEKPSADLLLKAAPAIFVLLWATGFIGAKYGLPYAEPLTFLLARFVIVALILLVVALVTRAPWPRSRAAVLHSLMSGILIHGIYLGGVFWAIARGMPAGVSALIVGVQPLLTAFVSRLLLNEKVLPLQWIGIAFGFFGLVMVLQPKLAGIADAGMDGLTLFLNVAALLGITAGTIYQKIFAAHADLRTGGFYQYVSASALMLVGVLAFEDGRIEWTADFLFALGWLVVVLSFGAISLLMLLIRHGAISRVAALFYLVPPVTSLVAYVMFGETLVTIQIVGIAVTAFSVWLASRRPA